MRQPWTFRASIGCLFFGLHEWENRTTTHKGRRHGDDGFQHGYSVSFRKCIYCGKETRVTVKEVVF